MQKNNPFVHTNTVVWLRRPADLHDFTHAPETTTRIQSHPREKCPNLLDSSWTRGSNPPRIRYMKAQRETVWHGCTATMGRNIYVSSLHPFIGSVSVSGAAPHSATHQKWLLFPLTLPDIILLSEHRKYLHKYCIW